MGYVKEPTEEIYIIERAETPGRVEVWYKIDGYRPRHREYLGLLKGRRIYRSALNSCIANLKQIEGAKANWAMEKRKSANDVPCDTDLVGDYLRLKPQCPGGGVYTIGSVAKLPACSFTNHVLPP